MFKMRDIIDDRTVLESGKRQKLNLKDTVKTLFPVNKIW